MNFFMTKLLPHQSEALERIGTYKIGCLFMEMGTGKTRTYLQWAFDRLKSSNTINIFAPVSTLSNLRKEILKHLPEVPVSIFWGKRMPESSTINIYGIESMSTSVKVISAAVSNCENGIVIIDESHFIKNMRAKRTRNIIQALQKSEHRLLSSGTPSPNGLWDLWAQCWALSPHVIGYNSWWSFSKNHIKLDEKGRVKDAINSEKISTRVARFSYYIRKEECLKLPDKKTHLVTVAAPDVIRTRYADFKAKMLQEYAEDPSNETIFYKMITGLMNLSNGIAPAGAGYSDLLFKKDTIKKISDSLTGKTIIFTSRIKELQEYSFLFDCVTISGKDSLKVRGEKIRIFEEEKDFMVASVGVGGTGLNLQFADNIIFCHPNFNYGERIQAVSRVHRMGAENNKNIYHIFSDTALDYWIQSNLNNKAYTMKKFLSEIKNRVEIAGKEFYESL